MSRFIPAYAGNSPLFPLPAPSFAVHPRLRGELGYRVSQVQSFSGSSPLTRGTRYKNIVKKRRGRFIPAYAGNSAIKNELTDVNPVHPRLRGELFFSTEVFMPKFGSSPLTRGTLISVFTIAPLASVHPRLRGELT